MTALVATSLHTARARADLCLESAWSRSLRPLRGWGPPTCPRGGSCTFDFPGLGPSPRAAKGSAMRQRATRADLIRPSRARGLSAGPRSTNRGIRRATGVVRFNHIEPARPHDVHQLVDDNRAGSRHRARIPGAPEGSLDQERRRGLVVDPSRRCHRPSHPPVERIPSCLTPSSFRKSAASALPNPGISREAKYSGEHLRHVEHVRATAR